MMFSNLSIFYLHSISMTVVSTVLAFIMMPVNIFIYTRLWIEELEDAGIAGSAFSIIPYDQLLIAFASTIIPAVLGIIIRRFSVKAAGIFSKVSHIIFIALSTLNRIKKWFPVYLVLFKK